MTNLALASITAPGTGAVTRTFSARLGDWFDVKDYGATGNGSTIETIAIQKCVNAALNAGGGIVFFPAGVYVLDGKIVFQYDSPASLTILGCGCDPTGGGSGVGSMIVGNGANNSLSDYFFYAGHGPQGVGGARQPIRRIVGLGFKNGTQIIPTSAERRLLFPCRD
jgi:hypothetical protein